jgi:hypothetical protein
MSCAARSARTPASPTTPCRNRHCPKCQGAAGFHRIRYYGLLASGKRAENIARARELLAPPPVLPIDAIKAASANTNEPQTPKHPCPCCGGRMIIIETFARGCQPKHQPTPAPPAIRIDTS